MTRGRSLWTLCGRCHGPPCHHNCANVHTPTDRPLGARPAAGPQPRAARARSPDRQLVRAPAGAALRRGAGGLGDGLELRDPPPQRAHLQRAAAHPSRGARRRTGLDPAVRRRTPSDALRRRAVVAAAGADAIDLNMGCPVPKVCKTGAGAALLADPERAVAVARAPARRAGLPVTVKLRSGQRPGEPGFELAQRLVEDAGVAAIASPAQRGRAPPGRPRHELAARLVATLAGPGDPHRRPHDAARRPRGVRAHRRRGGDARARSLGNPWLFEELLGPPSSRPRARGAGRARLGDRARRRASRRRARGALPAQVLPLVPGAPGPRPIAARRMQASLQARGTIAGARGALRLCRRRSPRRRGARVGAPLGLASLAILLRSLVPAAAISRRQAGSCGSHRPSTATEGHMPKDVILTPEGLEKLQEELALLSTEEAARGRRAHQGGPRVRRYHRELRVRRRQERAGDARGTDRPSRRSCAWRP